MIRRRLGLVALTAACLSGGAGTAASATISGVNVNVNGTGAGPGLTSSLQFLVGGGGRVVSQVTVPVTATGGLTVAFHGDPSIGCQADGVCAYAGTVDLPAASGQLAIVTLRRGHRTAEQVLAAPNPTFGDGASTTAVVDRTRPGGGTARCADAVVPSNRLSVTVHGTTVTLGLPVGAGLTATRCAGPTGADLAAATPRAVLPVSALRAGRRTVDLTADRSFAADGFAGTVRSTIILHLGVPHRERLSGGGSFPPGIHVVRERTLQAGLTVVGAAGRLTEEVTGAGPALCPLLDSCGLTETVGLPVAVSQSSGSLFVAARASAPVAPLRAALGLAGPRAASGAARTAGRALNGEVSFRDDAPAPVTATQDATTCHGLAGPGQDLVRFVSGGGRLIAVLSSFAPRHSVCPGPLLGSDLQPITLATGSLPLAALAGRTFAVHLVPASGPLADDGYSVRLTGRLTLTLRRGQVTQHVVRAPGP